MRIAIVLNGGVSTEADVPSIMDFLNEIRGKEWVMLQNGALHTNQIVAISEVQSNVAEIKEGE